MNTGSLISASQNGDRTGDYIGSVGRRFPVRISGYGRSFKETLKLTMRVKMKVKLLLGTVSADDFKI